MIQIIQEVYTNYQKAQPKKGMATKSKRGYKKTTHPQREPNQSKTLSRDKGSSSINILVHDYKIQTKDLAFGSKAPIFKSDFVPFFPNYPKDA